MIYVNNLADAYGHLGDYGKEAELYEYVYSVRVKTLGEYHEDTLESLNNLHDSYKALGNLERCKDINEKIKNEINLGNIICIFNYSILYGNNI